MYRYIYVYIDICIYLCTFGLKVHMNFFTACMFVHLSVYVCAGLRISGVRNRKLTQPFGCSPNWLRAVDRMLTEHIA